MTHKELTLFCSTLHDIFLFIGGFIINFREGALKVGQLIRNPKLKRSVIVSLFLTMINSLADASGVRIGFRLLAAIGIVTPLLCATHCVMLDVIVSVLIGV